MGRGQKIGIFLFSQVLAGHAPQQVVWALRWHWTGYRCTGWQCALHRWNTNRRWCWKSSAWHRHTYDTQVREAGADEKWNEAAYVMPDWVGRMASGLCKHCLLCILYIVILWCEMREHNSSNVHHMTWVKSNWLLAQWGHRCVLCINFRCTLGQSIMRMQMCACSKFHFRQWKYCTRSLKLHFNTLLH